MCPWRTEKAIIRMTLRKNLELLDKTASTPTKKIVGAALRVSAGELKKLNSNAKVNHLRKN